MRSKEYIRAMIELYVKEGDPDAVYNFCIDIIEYNTSGRAFLDAKKEQKRRIKKVKAEYEEKLKEKDKKINEWKDKRDKAKYLADKYQVQLYDSNKIIEELNEEIRKLKNNN